MQVLIGTRTISWSEISQENVHGLVQDFLNYFSLLQINFLILHIITNYSTTGVCNFSRGVLTRHILKNIRVEYTFSKTRSYRTATSLKRDFDTGVFLWVYKQLFYRTPVINLCKSRLHYRVVVTKNFTNWQENICDRVLYIIVAGKKARNFSEKKNFMKYIFSWILWSFPEKYFRIALHRAQSPWLPILVDFLNFKAIFFMDYSRYSEAQYLCFRQYFVTTLQSLFQSPLPVV